MDRPEIFTLKEYIIDQKLLAVRDTYIIKDKDGNEIGKALKKLISIGPKLFVYDKNDNLVARVEGRILSLRRTFDFYDRNGLFIGSLKRKIFKFLGSAYRIEDVQGNRIYDIKGNFTAHEYKFYDPHGREVATISKKRLSIRDSYGIKITGDIKPEYVILSAISIDQIEHEE